MEEGVQRAGGNDLRKGSRTELGGEASGKAAGTADERGGTVLGGEPAASLILRAAVREDASRFCPVCSRRLESRRCKLICDACGYYMSCADYY